MAAGLL